MRLSFLKIAVLLAVAAPAAQAQTQPPVAPSALQPQRQGDIAFVSGGVGAANREAMKAVRDRYNLRLLFAAHSGAYIANVGVTLVNARGRAVLDTVADGPLFYARVPPGRYRVTVSSQGRTIARTVTISARGAVDEDFHWPEAD